MFICIHCITAKTIETVPGHYTGKTAGLAMGQQPELSEGLHVSWLGMGRERRKSFLFAFVVITLPLVTLVLGKYAF